MQGYDPRFAQGVRPLAQQPTQGHGQPQHPQHGGHPVGPRPVSPSSYTPPPPYAQAQPGFGQPPQPQAYGQPPSQPQAPAYGQAPQYGQPPAYGQAPAPTPFHSQPTAPSQAYGQAPPQQQQQQPSNAGPSWGVPGVSFGGMPGLPGGLSAGLGNLAGKGPKGLPAPIAFGLTLAAVAIALVFDVIFLKIHIPGVGGYAWYLTTALSFAGAGWASIMWTKASKSVATTAMVVAGVVYGVADLGLGLVLEDLSMGGAIVLGAQGVAIACVCGVGGIYKALRSKDDASA